MKRSTTSESEREMLYLMNITNSLARKDLSPLMPVSSKKDMPSTQKNTKTTLLLRSIRWSKMTGKTSAKNKRKNLKMNIPNKRTIWNSTSITQIKSLSTKRDLPNIMNNALKTKKKF